MLGRWEFVHFLKEYYLGGQQLARSWWWQPRVAMVGICACLETVHLSLGELLTVQ
jgi:hypothetical protein